MLFDRGLQTPRNNKNTRPTASSGNPGQTLALVFDLLLETFMHE